MNNEELILKMLTDMNTRFDVLEAKMDAGFAEVRETAEKNFSSLADSQAHITEVVGESHTDLSDHIVELTDVVKQLSYDHMLIRKRAAQ